MMERELRKENLKQMAGIHKVFNLSSLFCPERTCSFLTWKHPHGHIKLLGLAPQNLTAQKPRNLYIPKEVTKCSCALRVFMHRLFL